MPENNAGPIRKLIEIDRIENGVVFLKKGGLRKIIMVAGINFDLKSDEEQQLILYSFQEFLNSLDFPIQFNVRSRKISVDNYLKILEEKEKEEQSELLKTQIKTYREFIQSFVSQNDIMEKSFFVTVPYDTVSLPSIKRFSKKKKTEKEVSAKPEEALEKLNQRVESVVSGLRQIGLRAVVLEDPELLELYYNFYNPALVGKEMGAKESFCPESVAIAPNYLKINDRFVKSFFVLGYPRYLSTGWLSSIINLPETMDIAIQISPADTGIILKRLRAKAAEVGAQISELEEKGYVRDPMLETALQDIETLRDSLQQSQEKLFSVGLYVTIQADELQGLNRIEEKINSILDSRLIVLKPALFEQIKGFGSALPLADDKLKVKAPFNSQPLSSFFPFTSADLTSDSGILYGVNLHNNTLIIFDRFSLENANMVVFAKAGSGKSYATKLEVLRSLMFGTDVLIIDPENEYQTLAESVGGSIFKISLDSENHINPFEVPVIPEGEDAGEILKSHIVNLAGLLKLMLGEISAEEEALLDRAITETYASRDIMPDKDFRNAEPPLLKDLETILRNIKGGEKMADRLYRFIEGSYAGFTNMPTNIDIKNRLIVFSVRDLEDELRPIAMYIILNFVWNLIRAEFKKRIMIIDEAWTMMKYPDSASFLFGLAKRARKYYLGISTITQDVEDFLSSPYGRPIITNSSLQLLLKQSPATADITAKAFGLTEAEKNYLLEVDIGQGLFLAGLKHAAIQIVPSYFENEIITTNPEELSKTKRGSKQ